MSLPTEGDIISAAENTGQVEHSWKFAMRSPVHLMIVLSDSGYASRSSFPPDPGYIRLCGSAHMERGGEPVKVCGPMLECRELGYALERDDGRIQCLRMLGSVPHGLDGRDFGGMRICPFCSPEAVRAPYVQTSHVSTSDVAPIRTVDDWLVSALHTASKSAPEPVRAIAERVRGDAHASLVDRWLLGTYLFGFAKGARPWSSTRSGR